MTMSVVDMKKMGLTERFLGESRLYDGLFAGRVVSQYKNLYKVVGDNGEMPAEISGKLRFDAHSLSDFPVVGDFVMLDRDTALHGNATIHHILSRKSALVRKAAGTSHDEQVLASNMDTIFICMSLNNDFNLRRLERYLSIAWDSRAVPVVVLTKADLCDHVEDIRREVETVSMGVDVLSTSALAGDGYNHIREYIKEGETVVFIGSSGVGKSTLINRLLGAEQLDTQNIGNADKGRHTTTRRDLICLPDGGVVIDTPGMREVGLETADLFRTFSDIEQLTTGCRFSDCTHTNEPGCAIRQAIGDGLLSAERLHSYQKLQKELKYDGLSAKQIEVTKLNDMFGAVGGMKNARKFAKSGNKNTP